MQAMVVTEFGGEEVLQLQDVPDPVPGEHDLLVEVHASAMNPVDWKVRTSGLRMPRQFPFILGFDVSGIVKAMGNGVDGFRVGDAVYASPSLSRDGSNADLVCVDARSAAIKPAGLDHVAASAMPLVTLTAWETLHERARTEPGQTVLIHAGAGGVGHLAIQMAKLHGCRVLTTASRPESIAFCEQLGADVVINYCKEDFTEVVRDYTDGAGCHLVFDTVGDDVFQKSLACVGVEGSLVTICRCDTRGAVDALFFKNASLHFEFMGAPTVHGVHPESQGRILAHCAQLVDDGKLKPHVGTTLPLEQLPEAHRMQRSGHTMGKIVLTVKS